MTAPEERFLAAFNILLSEGKIGVRQFCRDMEINQGNFSTFRKGTTTRCARVEWFSELCRYGVSADWLLTGRGSMFNQRNVK